MNHIAIRLLTLGLLLAPALGWAAEPNAEQAKGTNGSEKLSFREPFTLKLHVDEEHYYEEKFNRKIPFVARNNVYLFSGESFGLRLSIANGEIGAVTYQKEKTGADIEVKFEQVVHDKGNAMMMLKLKSNIKQVLYLDALMTVPGEKRIYKTSILPLQAGLGLYETWPHPIVQLVLTNLRFKKETPNKSAESTRRPADQAPDRPR
jgi:hypothetical protein